MRFINIFLVIVAGAFVQGCNVINPPEQIPTFIHIDSFSFNNADPSKTVGGTNEIGSVWVYYNNNSVGAFDLPADIPILATGHGQLQVAAGVTQNGLQSYQALYPFYLRDTSSFEAAPGKTINYKPVTQYIPGAIFPWFENFETASSFVTIDSTPNVARIANVVTDPVTGAAYGNIALTSSRDSTEVIAQKPFLRPASAAFCELDYKGDVPLYVGLVGVTSTVIYSPYYIIGLKESDKWQKIYINLANYIGNYPANTYYVVFKAVLPAGKQSGNVSIDNIKIVTQ